MFALIGVWILLATYGIDLLIKGRALCPAARLQRVLADGRAPFGYSLCEAAPDPSVALGQ
jgi:polyferredoxin